MIQPVSIEEFAALMAGLGPFPADRRVAVAVSGGPDSMALAWLAACWGRPLALVVDHGLRAESAPEAALTIRRLGAIGVAARLLPLALAPGASVAERARAARYEVLFAACAEAGLPHLLLGHQEGDQAETVLMRISHRSQMAGRAGMARAVPRGGVLLLRPLLGIARARLRATLEQAGIAWVDDPSNADPRAERARLRALLADGHGDAPTLHAASRDAAAARRGTERAAAEFLARHAELGSGWAWLPQGPWPAAALSGLVRATGGGAYPPPWEKIAALAAAPGAATLAGARLLRGRDGWFVAREAAAMQGAVAAQHGAIWDGRFRLEGTPPDGWTFGPLGADAARKRHRALPSAVLATLPALRDAAGALRAAPALGLELPPGLAVFPAPKHPVTREFDATRALV